MRTCAEYARTGVQRFHRRPQVTCLGEFALVQAHRRLLHSGVLHERIVPKNAEASLLAEPRQFFLFNDILLFTRAASGGKFKFELYVDLSSARVFEIESDADFEISDRLRSWVLVARDSDDRRLWMRQLQQAIGEQRRSMQSFNQHDLQPVPVRSRNSLLNQTR